MRAATLTGVPRVLITGDQPHHLSATEAHAWVRQELPALRALPGVEAVVLTRAQASNRHPRPWAWVCELHLAHDADGHACAEHPLCSEWLRDLRLLGMRPALAVLTDGERMT